MRDSHELHGLPRVICDIHKMWVQTVWFRSRYDCIYAELLQSNRRQGQHCKQMSHENVDSDTNTTLIYQLQQ